MHAPTQSKASRGHGSIIFDHECAPLHRQQVPLAFLGRWRGIILRRGSGPDGKRRRYKLPGVSGQTGQYVIEALKSEEIDAGLSTSRPCKVETAVHGWLARAADRSARGRFTGMRWRRS